MAGSHKQCILLIDDSPVMIGALSQILTPAYDVKVAHDGKAGIEMAAGGGIDLILLDIVMPGMSGFEVLAALKQNQKAFKIPVIFITGSNTIEDEAKGLSLGAVDYIRKPFFDAIVTLRVRLHLQLVSQMRIIERFSLADGLTGLDNRRSFDIQFKAEWEEAVRAKSCISMIMLDIDKFKLFNDRYGHLAGDICLKTIAETLKKSMGLKADCVFRWGGEEFVIILSNIPFETAKVKAGQLREDIENTDVCFEGQTVNVTASFGVCSVSPTPTDVADTFFDQLDDALYKAKKNGRNRVETIG